MERRLKEHIDETFLELEDKIRELQRTVDASDTESEDTSNDENLELLRDDMKDMEKRLSKRLFEISQGIERQLQVILRLDPPRDKGSKKRSATEAFEVIDDEHLSVDPRQSSGHGSSNQRSEKRFETQLSNVQAHLESAVCEMKSGTFSRLADLDERIDAVEKKVDRMARSIGKEAASDSDAI